MRARRRNYQHGALPMEAYTSCHVCDSLIGTHHRGSNFSSDFSSFSHLPYCDTRELLFLRTHGRFQSPGSPLFLWFPIIHEFLSGYHARDHASAPATGLSLLDPPFRPTLHETCAIVRAATYRVGLSEPHRIKNATSNTYWSKLDPLPLGQPIFPGIVSRCLGFQYVRI